jgi:DNA ligase-1
MWENKTLYKKNASGKLLQWNIFVEGNKYWAEYGQVGGKIQSDTPTICESKNVGRSNETTPEEQALSEAKSKFDKQKDIRGYVEDKDDLDKFVFKPTLAHKYVDHAKKLPEQVYASCKMDGIRCYITKDGAFSRNGKKWVTTEFIETTLRSFFEKNPEVVLDGELYAHKYSQDFNKIVSLAKKKKHIREEEWWQIETELQFHVFDLFHYEYPDLSFDKRYKILDKIFGNDQYHNIVRVESVLINKTEFHTLYQTYMEQGYEGIMLRDPSSKYEFKRSYGLLKYKEFLDTEYEIVDILEGVGNRSSMMGKMLLKTGDKTFESSVRGNERFYKDVWKNKDNYIGKLATIRYQNLTPDSIPRFPVCISIRDYE